MYNYAQNSHNELHNYDRTMKLQSSLLDSAVTCKYY